LLAGTFGSSPLANGGGTVSDIFDVRQRALGISLFSLAPFLGPILGPIVGGFAAESKGWRSPFWIMLGFSIVMLLATFFLVPETYGPVLLRQRARFLQEESKQAGEERSFIGIFDRGMDQSFAKKMKTSLLRPFLMLTMDLICFLLALYAALVCESSINYYLVPSSNLSLKMEFSTSCSRRFQSFSKSDMGGQRE
jgi:MFS family permease